MMSADTEREAKARPGQDGLADAEARAEFRIVLRPLASSLPLGFFAFTVGTVLLSALELHWTPAAQDAQLMALVLAFVVPLEALSGLFAFLARDSGAATGLTTLSASWLATSLTVMHGPPGALSLPLSIFLLTLTAVMLIMSVTAMTGKPLFGVLLLAGACRFALTGVYQATGATAVEQAGAAGPVRRSRAASATRCTGPSRNPASAASCNTLTADISNIRHLSHHHGLTREPPGSARHCAGHPSSTARFRTGAFSAERAFTDGA